MEIILGKSAGFCYGVERAVEGAKERLKIYNNLCCLGEIVHNKEVLKNLEKKGMKFVEDVKKVKNDIVIRAHGIEKQLYEYFKNKNINIIDYTCPNVLRIHKIAEEYSKDGYYIFLCGSKAHPENIGTISFFENGYSVIQSEEEVYNALEDFKKSKIKKLLLISQTTFSVEKFDKISKKIKQNINEEDIILESNNTICRATEIRQKETKEIARKVDYMLIIGGENSSNTKKLYEIAKNNCKNTQCIETYKQINIKDILNYKKIGIMAGASTPKESIKDVFNKLNQISKITLNV